MLLPASASATWGPVPDFTALNADGSVNMIYYDIYNGATTGRNDLNAQLLFFQDAVKNRNNLANWSYLGYEVLKNGGEKNSWWNHNGHGFDANFGVDGDYTDLISQWGSNLKTATTLKDVEYAARKRVSDYFVHNGKREVGTGDIEGIPEWQSDDTVQTIFYTDAFSCDNDAGQRYYNYFGLAFYDFKLKLLADENLSYSSASDNYDSIEEAAQAGAPGVTYSLTPGSGDGFVSGVINQSTMPVLTTQEVTKTESATISNSITNSQTYSFSEMIGAALQFGKTSGAHRGWTCLATISTSFTAGQVYTSAYTSTNENTQTTSNTSSISVTLPPHTQVLMKQSEQTERATVAYDSPVVVTYKVAVYSLCGRKYWDGLFTHINYDDFHYLATFGKDISGARPTAVENLADRIKYSPLISGYEDSYGDSLNWTSIYFGGSAPTRSKNAVNWLISHMPMSVTGATLTFDYQGFQSEIYGIQPLYPLKYVTPAASEMILGYNRDKSVSDIALNGTDYSYTPYYGFDSKYGHWILLDSSGNPTTTSPIASLLTDPITNSVTLRTGTTTGDVYLKYIIDEDKYSWGSGAFYTKNSDLTGTAIIKVSVADILSDPPLDTKPWLRGNTANGGGWYTLEDNSLVNFSFNVKPVPNTSDAPTYNGQMLLTNEGKWRLKGTLDLYLNRGNLGRAWGSGALESWDSSLNKGKGGWVKAEDKVNFDIHFIDVDSLTLPELEGAPDRFGIRIDYAVPEGAPGLPLGDLMELQGGNINTRGLPDTTPTP